MKFSIVTPSYNYARYLPTAIDSVLAEQRRGIDLEHIIVDAASTDNTIEVLESYPHLQWTSEPDEGMSDGINKGFLKASGDLIMWLNADDAIIPGALEKVQAFAEANPDADVIYGDCVFTDSDLNPQRHKFEHRFDAFVLRWGGCYIPSTSCYYRRKIIEAGELIDVRYKVCMDFEYYMRLHHRGYQFGYLPEPLAYFRWHDENASNVLLGYRFRERREIQRHFLKQRGLGFLGASPILKLMLYASKAKRVLRKKLEKRGRGEIRD